MRKSTFILFILVIIFAVYIFVFEKNNYTTDDFKLIKNKLIDTKKENLLDIKIGNKLALKKNGKTWSLIFPMKAEVDKEKLNIFIDKIYSLKLNKFYKSKMKFKDKSKVIVIGLKNKTLKLIIGEKNIFKNGYYVLIEPINKIAVLDNIINEIYNINFNDLRNKKVFKNLESDSIYQIKILDEIVLTKKKISDYDSKWYFKKNNVEASWYKSNELADNLAELEIKTFVDNIDTNYNYGFNEKKKVEINNKEYILYIGNEKDNEDIYCSDNKNKFYYTIPKQMIDFFYKNKGYFKKEK